MRKKPKVFVFNIILVKTKLIYNFYLLTQVMLNINICLNALIHSIFLIKFKKLQFPTFI